jgi:hypothetical protein
MKAPTGEARRFHAGTGKVGYQEKNPLSQNWAPQDYCDPPREIRNGAYLGAFSMGSQ